MPPLNWPTPSRLGSTVYMRISKQRDCAATFVDRLAGSVLFGPHGAGGAAGAPCPAPRCAAAASPAGQSAAAMPTTIARTRAPAADTRRVGAEWGVMAASFECARHPT